MSEEVTIAFLRAEVKAAAERVKELEKELEKAKNGDDEASKIIREAAALISSPEYKNECDRLREKLAKCYGDRMVVDQRVKELEALFGGRASTILVGAKL